MRTRDPERWWCAAVLACVIGAVGGGVKDARAAVGAGIRASGWVADEPTAPARPSSSNATDGAAKTQRDEPGESVRDVSAVLAKIIGESKTPGMVAAIVRSDGGTRIVALGAAGVRKAGSEAKVTVDDRFHLGSCTKAMTATLCAMLVEEHKLAWDRPLGAALPELKDTMQAAYAGVTLADLLHHRAGLPDDLSGNGVWGKMWEFKGSGREARDALLPEVLKLPPVGKAGETFRYSNAGYAIAGWLAERAEGKAYEELMRERVWRPLGITSAGFGAPTGEESPRGHNGAGKPMEPGPGGGGASSAGADNPQAIAPAGTAHMTVSDWGRFVGLHLAGARARALGKPVEGLLLSEASFAALHTPVAGASGPGKDYAMGWMVTERPWADGAAFTHSGSNTMWFCTVWMAPRKDFAVLVAANAADKATQEAVDRAVGALIKVVEDRR